MSNAGHGESIPITSVISHRVPRLEFDGNNAPFVEQIEELPPGGLLLDAQHFFGREKVAGLSARFIRNHEDAEGRMASGHGVYFGRLVIGSRLEQETPTSVAVKPQAASDHWLPTASDVVAHEWAANTHVGSLTSYESTFLPLAVWKNEKGQPQLVTLFDEPTQTFDNVLWVFKHGDREVCEEKIRHAIHLGLQSLGFLHGAGLTHGDAVIRNFAKDSRNIRFVDLESARKLTDPDGGIENVEEARRKITEELAIFAHSLILFNAPEKAVDPFADTRAVISESNFSEKARQKYDRGIAEGERAVGQNLPDDLRIETGDFTGYFDSALAAE